MKKHIIFNLGKITHEHKTKNMAETDTKCIILIVSLANLLILSTFERVFVTLQKNVNQYVQRICTFVIMNALLGIRKKN